MDAIKKKNHVDREEEQKFAMCHGKQTQEEKDYLLKIGLTYENSDGEILEVSTLTETDFVDTSIFDESYISVSKDVEAAENIQQIESNNHTVHDIGDELLHSSSTSVECLDGVEEISMLHDLCVEKGNTEKKDLLCISPDIDTQLLETTDVPRDELEHGPFNAPNEEEKENIVPVEKMDSVAVSKLSQNDVGFADRLPVTPAGSTRNEKFDVKHPTKVQKDRENDIFSLSALSESSDGLKLLFPATPIPVNEVKKVNTVREEKYQTQQSDDAFSISALTESSVGLTLIFPATPLVNQTNTLNTELIYQDQEEQENRDTFSVSTMSDNGIGLQRLFPPTPVTISQVLRRSLRIAEKSYSTEFDCSNISESGMGLSGIFSEKREPDENQMSSSHNLSKNHECDAVKPELNSEESFGQYRITTPVSKYSAFISGVQDYPQPVLLTKRVAELKSRGSFSPKKKQASPKQFRTSTPRAVKVVYTSSVNTPLQGTNGIMSRISENSINIDAKANASNNSFELVPCPKVADFNRINPGKVLKTDSPCLINLNSSISNDNTKNVSLLAFKEEEKRISLNPNVLESTNSCLSKERIETGDEANNENRENCQCETEESFSVSMMSETGVGLRGLFPSTPIRSNQGLRRNLRIAQKTFRDFDTSTLSQSGIGLAGLFNETESTENCNLIDKSQTPQKNEANESILEIENLSDETRDISLNTLDQLNVSSPIAAIDDNILIPNETSLKISPDEIETTHQVYITEDSVADDPLMEIHSRLDESKIEDVKVMAHVPGLPDMSILEIQVESAVTAGKSSIGLEDDDILKEERQIFAHVDESIGFDDSFNKEQQRLLDVSNETEELCIIMATQEVPINNRKFENDNGDIGDSVNSVNLPQDVSINMATQEVTNGTFDSQQRIVEGVSEDPHDGSLIISTQEAILNRTFESQESNRGSNGPLSQNVNVIMDTQQVVLNRTFDGHDGEDSVIGVVSDIPYDISLITRGVETMNGSFEKEKGDTKDYLDDTIENMERILAAADAQEAEERRFQVEEQINKDASDNLNNINKTPVAGTVPEYLPYPDRTKVREIRESLKNSGGKGFVSGVRGSTKPVILDKRANELEKKDLVFSPSPLRPRPTPVVVHKTPIATLTEYLSYPDRKKVRGIRESLEKSGGKGSVSGVRGSQTPKPVILDKRVNELKKKGLFFSPSPPRPRPVAVLPKTIPKNQASPQPFKAPTPRPAKILSGSTTPVYIQGTPKRRSVTGVLAKVDTGLRSPGVSLGLNSPVANYIHSKAAPSPFHRNPGMPNKAQSTGKQWPVPLQQVQAVPGVKNSSLIPRPSLPQMPTVLSSQRRSLSGVMSSSKFNSRQGTNPSAVEPKFKQQTYTGPPQGQVRSNNDLSFEQKHSKENYKAQRHMGKRDSGNASIVQNAVIPKQFLPSRPTYGIDKQ